MRGPQGSPLNRSGHATGAPNKGVTMPDCIVCNTPNAHQRPENGNIRFDCDRCGAFVLTGSAEKELPNHLTPIRRSLMSHALRRMQRAEEAPPKISTYAFESFWREDRLPTPQQQVDNLILWIGRNQPTQFDFAEDKVPAIAATIGLPISGVLDSQGFGWLDSQLDEGKRLYIR